MSSRNMSGKMSDKNTSDKNYSWKGSPNAGLVLVILALVCGVALVLSGFS